MKRLPLAASFLLFIALCASVAYWGMQMFKPPLRPVAAPPRAAQAEIRTEAAASLFGARRASAAVAANYQLKGVIFSGNPRDSVAILSADGGPPQAVRVDREVAPGVTVKEVHRGYVLLSENGATKRVELPEEANAQDSLTVAPRAPTRPSAAPAIPSRAQPAPASPPPPQAPAANLPVPAQVPTPVPGQGVPPGLQNANPIPGQSGSQVPGQLPGQVTGQAPVQPVPPAGVPPTVVVSPPPSGQASTPPPATNNSLPAGVPQQPLQQGYPGTVPVPGSQQAVPGVPATR